MNEVKSEKVATVPSKGGLIMEEIEAGELEV
jgi:hypothetical protein